MQVVFLRRKVGRLRVVGIVIVAPGLVLHIGAPGDIGRFIASHTGLRCPQRKMPVAQVQIRHLLAAAVAGFLCVGAHAQPKTVDGRAELFKRQLRNLALNHHLNAEPPFQIQCPSAIRFFGPGHAKRHAFRQIILYFEIAAVHLDAFLPDSHIDHRPLRRGLEQNGIVMTQNPGGMIPTGLHDSCLAFFVYPAISAGREE